MIVTLSGSDYQFNYAAPELFVALSEGDGPHKDHEVQGRSKTMQADVYAFGCLYYAVCSGHAAIFIYKCPVIPRKRLYINAHPTGVRNSYVIMTARLRLDRIWHQCALSIFG